MYNNKNYERDINFTYELNRFVLRILGVWPYTNKKYCLLQKLKKNVLIFIFYFLLCFELMSMVLYIVMILNSPRAKLKFMASLLFTIVTVLKYSNLFYVKNQMKNCIACVEKDFQNIVNPTMRNTMLFHAKISRRLFILCGIFMYSGGMTYRTLLPLVRGKIVTVQNVTTRPLPCPGHYVVFDPYISPAYEIVFFVQCFLGVFKYTITVAACGIAALFTMHIVAQLDILMMLMNSLTNEYNLENVKEKLSTIVERQIKTQNFLRMVQDVIHFSSFIELMTCTSMICLMIYCIIVEWEDSNSLAMFSQVSSSTRSQWQLAVSLFTMHIIAQLDILMAII
ncbi:uncharacterized protein LOC116852909 isoform X2 [Odontomachus brunneus]|uniref:uncharacterized protein LOC116852909 isoform X2 n=1 Tax=Odontomachus brunneus TaxID=486640 RepID=UPI0013F243C9|nr:uncharacterized protein LOC116852909 isoform X2 [Odontomachus brunneus]